MGLEQDEGASRGPAKTYSPGYHSFTTAPSKSLDYLQDLN